jgi:hypothetical protein
MNIHNWRQSVITASECGKCAKSLDKVVVVFIMIIMIIIIIIIIIIITALQPFIGPWPPFNFLDSIQSVGLQL